MRRTIRAAHMTARCVQKHSSELSPNIGGGADKNEFLIQRLPISLAAGKIAARPSSVNALTVAMKTAAKLQEHLGRSEEAEDK